MSFSSSSSSSASCPKKMITLKSSDGETFEIEETVALQSKTLENMIDGNCADTPIPLPSINGKVLAKVVEFCNKHAEVGVDAESPREWDSEFVNVEYTALFDYILAANFLEIPTLLDLASVAVGEMMKGKTPAEIRKVFNISDTFSPEEEEPKRCARRTRGHLNEASDTSWALSYVAILKELCFFCFLTTDQTLARLMFTSRTVNSSGMIRTDIQAKI